MDADTLAFILVFIAAAVVATFAAFLALAFFGYTVIGWLVACFLGYVSFLGTGDVLLSEH